MLGLPAEMYTYGTQYYLIVFAEALVSFTMAAVYLPVFFKLQITSSYEVKLGTSQPEPGNQLMDSAQLARRTESMLLHCAGGA